MIWILLILIAGTLIGLAVTPDAPMIFALGSVALVVSFLAAREIFRALKRDLSHLKRDLTHRPVRLQQIEPLLDRILYLSTEAERLCALPAANRDPGEAAELADALEKACQEMVRSGVNVDVAKDGLSIRRSLAAARVNIDELRTRAA